MTTGADQGAQPRTAGGGRIALVGFPDAFSASSWVQDRPIDVVRYRDATATPFELLPVPSGPPNFAGGLYDADGRLIAESERRVGRGRRAVNPPTIGRRQFAPRIAGEHVYVGMAIQSFGHFLLETLSRLWWVEKLDDLAGVRLLLHGWKAHESQQSQRDPSSLFVRWTAPFRGRAAPVGAGNFLKGAWVAQFLDILGIELDRVDFVPPAGARLTNVRVPARIVEVNGFVHPALPRIYRLIGDTVAGDVPPGGRRLYLSRSRLMARGGVTGAPRRAANEEALENLLAGAGFEIVHPQEHSIVAQIRMMRAAAVVAGCDGSALHGVVFARPGTRVLAFDSRAIENQFGIEEACGAHSRHLWMGGRQASAKGGESWTIDLDLVRRNLDFATESDVGVR